MALAKPGELSYPLTSEQIELIDRMFDELYDAAGESSGDSGTITLPDDVTGVLDVPHGGTGLSVYAVGDILYASAATTLTSLAAAAAGNVLLSGAVPSWGKVGLTTHVTGTLPVTNGGTGLAAVAQGDILYASAANTLASLAKNTTATRYLSNTGASNAPAWAQVALATGVSGVLPYANLTNALAASLLLGRGSLAGAGAWEEITLGAGLTMTNKVLSAASGGTWDVLTNGDAADPELIFDSFGNVVMMFTP